MKLGNGNRICRRNPDYSSVFCTKLIAVEKALSFFVNEGVNSDIWILSNSLIHSIQHLSEWCKHGDSTAVNIVQHLGRLSAHNKIFFQWVPSHADVYSNEIADQLPSEGSLKSSTDGGSLSFLELASQVKLEINSTWSQAPMIDTIEKAVEKCFCNVKMVIESAISSVVMNIIMLSI
ncbi:hypothetical protein X975_15147, partial [Stegodyphus mimosarum]